MIETVLNAKKALFEQSNQQLAHQGVIILGFNH
jgi:hypothetical protein